ncbi:MAG: flagellar hook-length control protein FliK [Deltaproteobacteria bacterium]|nr:flagellar hook-length control protein FliK [Deltaproteobacteria bacterium]
MEILMNCFSDLSGAEKGLLEGGIGKGQSTNGSGSDEIPFLQMLKERLSSNSKNKIPVMGKCFLTEQEGADLKEENTGKSIQSLKKEDLKVLFSALAGLAQNRFDKGGGTVFSTGDGIKENPSKLIPYHGLQKGDAAKAIFDGRNGREISPQDVKNLINHIMKGFERIRSGSESGFVPGKAKQEIVDILKGFGFNEKEIEGLLSVGKNEKEQNEIAVMKESDIGRDTGKKLYDVKTGELSAAVKEIVKEFRESQPQNVSALSSAAGEESDGVKKNVTAMKSNGSEKNKTETINTEMKQNATVPKAGLRTAITALNATARDNTDDIGKRGNLLSGKDSTVTNDTARHLKTVNTQGQGEKEGNTKFANENGPKDVVITPVEEFHQEGRLVHRSGDGNHVTVSHGSMPSANTTENRGTVAMNPRVVINQVIDATGEKLTKGFGRIRIELNPPHLGTVDMDVLVRDSKVHVVLQTENYNVKQLLQSNMEQLKTSLHTQGLTADTITVYVQEKPDGNHYEYGQNGAPYQEMNDRRNDRDNQTGFRNSMTDSSSISPEGESTVGLDGRISLFA